jgi:hypothetical protein
MSADKEVLNLLIKNATKVNRRDNSLLMRRTRRYKDFDLDKSSISPENLVDILYKCKPGEYSIIDNDINQDTQNDYSYKN